MVTSWGNSTGGGGRGSATADESLSGCDASPLVDREEEGPAALRAGGRGEAPPLARAAASAACRSFFLRVSSAPRLELSGRREGGERLAGRLLWELPPVTPEEVCLLLREREEERREDE